MSKQRNDGGPAFPVNYSNEADGPTVMPTAGMSMRDYFAAKAMQAMIARVPFDNPHSINKDAVCTAAYQWGDAMLKARESAGAVAAPDKNDWQAAGLTAAWKALHNKAIIPASNRYIRAIKAHREACGSSLREAKDAVDGLKSGELRIAGMAGRE